MELMLLEMGKSFQYPFHGGAEIGRWQIVSSIVFARIRGDDGNFHSDWRASRG